MKVLHASGWCRSCESAKAVVIDPLRDSGTTRTCVDGHLPRATASFVGKGIKVVNGCRHYLRFPGADADHSAERDAMFREDQP